MINFAKLSLIVVLTLINTGAWAQTPIYVSKSATGANNGSSWADAYTDLQPAIDAAVGGKQIWVAAGTYLPTANLGGTDNARDRAFVLKEGVKIYGGFAGDEDPETFNLDTRDFNTNETILSGGNTTVTKNADGTVTAITGNTSNAYHVVVSYDNTTATVLDGFTVSGGYANLTGSPNEGIAGYSFNRSQGAGIFILKSSPTLRNLVVTHNRATASGTVAAASGIYIQGDKYNGAGLPVDAINLVNVSVLENFGVARGAGMYIVEARAVIEDSRFIGNNTTATTVREGGAIYVSTDVTLDVKNTLFANNAGAGGGGAIATLASATNPSIINITDNSEFRGNKSEGTGGGLRISTGTTVGL